MPAQKVTFVVGTFLGRQQSGRIIHAGLTAQPVTTDTVSGREQMEP